MGCFFGNIKEEKKKPAYQNFDKQVYSFDLRKGKDFCFFIPSFGTSVPRNFFFRRYYAHDTFLQFWTGKTHLGTALQAADAEIHASAHNFKGFSSAGMIFFQLDDIADIEF